MREVARYGLIRVVRAWLRYHVLNGSVVTSTHWTRRAALKVARAER